MKRSAGSVQGGSNMTGTNCDLFAHKSSRSYLNHLVNMEWTNDATLQLFSEYQKYVALWDSTRKFYKLVNIKNDAWEEIAK
jgi:hypothetical protein